MLHRLLLSLMAFSAAQRSTALSERRSSHCWFCTLPLVFRLKRLRRMGTTITCKAV